MRAKKIGQYYQDARSAKRRGVSKTFLEEKVNEVHGSNLNFYLVQFNSQLFNLQEALRYNVV